MISENTMVINLMIVVKFHRFVDSNMLIDNGPYCKNWYHMSSTMVLWDS